VAKHVTESTARAVNSGKVAAQARCCAVTTVPGPRIAVEPQPAGYHQGPVVAGTVQSALTSLRAALHVPYEPLLIHVWCCKDELGPGLSPAGDFMWLGAQCPGEGPIAHAVSHNHQAVALVRVLIALQREVGGKTWHQGEKLAAARADEAAT
jgi:hypothetical protein